METEIRSESLKALKELWRDDDGLDYHSMAAQPVRNGWNLTLVNRLDVYYEKRTNDLKVCW